jgi:hypothetical protein
MVYSFNGPTYSFGSGCRPTYLEQPPEYTDAINGIVLCIVG